MASIKEMKQMMVYLPEPRCCKSCINVTDDGISKRCGLGGFSVAARGSCDLFERVHEASKGTEGPDAEDRGPM